MRKSRFSAPASAGTLLLAILSLTVFNRALASGSTDPAPGSSITRLENFARDPLTQGWTLFGDANLFRWNSTSQNLEVTWDSSRSNSYLQLPLGTVLSRTDDFRVELDLLLHEIAGGIRIDRPGPMQLAFGFQNRSDAQSSRFNRGTGTDSPNLVEFNFFPDTGFGPTVWPAVYSTNSGPNYNGGDEFSLFDLPTGITMHIELAYTSSNQTVLTAIRANGTLIGPITSAYLATNATSLSRPFTQFEVDTFAISSYSDLALAPSPYAGSLLARGVIDNLTITFPSPPIQEEQFRLADGYWEQSVLSRGDWHYRLQATTDFRTWMDLTEVQKGTGGRLVLRGTAREPNTSHFYRIHASPAR